MSWSPGRPKITSTPSLTNWRARAWPPVMVTGALDSAGELLMGRLTILAAPRQRRSRRGRSVLEGLCRAKLTPSSRRGACTTATCSAPFEGGGHGNAVETGDDGASEVLDLVEELGPGLGPGRRPQVGGAG